jgi:hypothetical protein
MHFMTIFTAIYIAIAPLALSTPVPSTREEVAKYVAFIFLVTPSGILTRPEANESRTICRIASYEEADYNKRSLAAAIAASQKGNLTPRSRGRPGHGWCTVM